MENQHSSQSGIGLRHNGFTGEQAAGLILENTNECFMLVDRSLQVIYLNSFCRQLFVKQLGLAIAEGDKILDFVSQQRRPDLAKLYDEVFLGQQRTTVVEIPKDAYTIFIEVSFRPVRDASGNISCVLITSRDITEKRKSEIILAAFEERWRFALEGANYGVWDWNMQTNEMYFSDSYKKLYGFDDHDIVNHFEEWMSRVHPEDAIELRNAIENHSQSEDPYHETVYRLKDKHEKYRWISGRGKIISRDENGKPVRMIGIHADITNQKRETDNYKILFYDSPLPMWACDSSSLRFLDVNNASSELYGYTKEEFGRMALPDIFHELSADAGFKAFLSQESLTKFTIIARQTNRKKQPLFVEITATRIERDNTKIILGLSKDITDSVKYQEDLKRSNERFLLASKAASDAIYDWDLTTNDFYWNESMRLLFGHDPSNLTIEKWESLLHPEDRERVKQDLVKALTGTEAAWQNEYRFRKADGSYSYVLERGFIARDKNRKAVRMIGSLQDFSKRKYAEQLLALERHVFELALNTDEDFSCVITKLLLGIADIHGDLFASVILFKDDQSVSHCVAPRLSRPFTEAFFDQKFGPLDSPCGTTFQTKEIVIDSDIAHHPLWEKFRALANQFQLKACWSLPLVTGKDKVPGVFAIYLKEARHPTELELNTLNRIRYILTILIERNRAVQEIKMMNERFDNMMKATNDLIWDMDVETNQCYRSPEGLEKVYGIKNNEEIESFGQFLKKIHPADRNKVEKEFERITTSEAGKSFELEYRFKGQDGFYSFVYDRAIVIRSKEGKPVRIIGAAQNITERKELEKEVLMHELQKQRAINQATIDTQEKERTEIGRELHDNVNQVLTTTKLYLELAMSNHELKEELIAKSSANVISVINEIRQLSRSLMDANIDDLGLVDSLNDLSGNINLTGKLKVVLFADKKLELVLNKNQQLTVYRILQEVLNNAVRHSGASEVVMSFVSDTNLIEIGIQDNGVGFDPSIIKRGAGLKNIENRVYLLNGTFTIESKPGQGCRFTIKFPVS